MSRVHEPIHHFGVLHIRPPLQFLQRDMRQLERLDNIVREVMIESPFDGAPLLFALLRERSRQVPPHHLQAIAQYPIYNNV